MKKLPKIHRAFVTISLLILLTSVLLIILLFNDDSLRLHSSIANQRQQYVRQHIDLQKQFQQQQFNLCQNLDLSLVGNFTTASMTSSDSEEHQHFIWCQRQALFKKSPTKNLNEEQFDNFIDKDAFVLFQARAIQNVNYFPSDNGNNLFWFDQAQTEWNINGNLSGIVIATGNLHIAGKGKITGSVITQGAFSKDDTVTLSYKKAVVTELVQSYSRWQKGEKTWHDFIP
ncbi:DUF2572 family protein [Lonepinella koalarum]|uniref:DUF2572 family protein n=1 Tax=Lonepinella koalarum TaxID=53417 RepID=UPI003F6DBEF3